MPPYTPRKGLPYRHATHIHVSKQRRTVLTNPHARNTVGRSNLDDELDGILGVVAAIARDNDGAAGELPCVQRPKYRLHVVHTNKGSTSAYWCRSQVCNT